MAGVKRQAGETQRTQQQTFLYVSKTSSCNPAGLCSFFEAIQFVAKVNSNKTQNLTLTEAILLRQIMYSYSQQTRCFRNSYNVAWPCRPEPTSDGTVLTTAACNIGSSIIKLCDMRSNTTHTVTSIVSFLIETTVAVRGSECQSHQKDAQTLWVRLPACGSHEMAGTWSTWSCYVPCALRTDP